MSVCRISAMRSQQLLEQLVERQVAERRVGDPLERLERARACRALALVHARVVDRHRRAVGGELEQLARRRP